MLKKIAIFFTFFLLFFVIRYNALDTVDYSGLMQPLDTDYWIAGSIVYAKKHGFFANHCFNTRFINKSLSNNQNKKNTVEYYENNDTSIFEANGYWKVYRSALRTPTNFYILVDQVLFKLFKTHSNMPTLKSINAFLLTVVLSLILYWILVEFGFISFIIVALSLIYSHWIIRFGQYPNFSIFIRYLPFLGSLLLLRYYDVKKIKVNNTIVFCVIFLCIFSNQLIDYEFTPVVMAGGVLPFFYYNIKNNWSLSTLIKRVGIVSIASLSAFSFAFIIHIYLVSLELGGLNSAIEYFQTKVLNMSFVTKNVENRVAPRLQNCIESDLLDVLKQFFSGKNLVYSFNLKDLTYLIVAIVSCLVISSNFNQNFKLFKRKCFATFTMLIIALAASFCNLIMFKSHAACHTHLDYLFFVFPFTILAALFTASSIELFIKIIYKSQLKDKS